MKHTFDLPAYLRMKKNLSVQLPHIPARVRAEALARGLGHKNASQLKVLLNEPSGKISIRADVGRPSFEDYLEEKGYIASGDLHKRSHAAKAFLDCVIGEVKLVSAGIWYHAAADGNRFMYSSEFDEIDMELNVLLDKHDIGYGSFNPEYHQEIKAFTKRYCKFPDGWAHLGASYLHKDKPKAALRSAGSAKLLCETLLPLNYSEPLRYHELDNRPYHRALCIEREALMRLERTSEALATEAKLKLLDPDRYD